MNTEFTKSILKAVVAGLAAGASYLIGVVPAESTFGDVSFVQWLGLIPIVAATFGVTWRVPNTPRPTIQVEDEQG